MAALKYVVENLPVDDIFIVGNRRPVDEAAIAALAESIRENGLQMPITVRVDENIPDPDTGEIMGAWALITGAHRLGAYRLLGLTSIPAIVRDCDEIDAEIMEITENLHRADLTKEQRDIQIRRYAELILAKEAREQVKADAPKPTQNAAVLKSKGGRGKEGIASKVAKQTGVSKDTVRRALFQPDPAKIEESKARKEHDRIIKADLSDDAAQLLFDKFGGRDVPHLLSVLDGSSLKEIIAGLRRRLHDAPVMDRSAA